MDLMDFGTVQEGKMRLVQEMVPGKQVTLAHICLLYTSDAADD